MQEWGRNRISGGMCEAVYHGVTETWIHCTGTGGYILLKKQKNKGRDPHVF